MAAPLGARLAAFQKNRASMAWATSGPNLVLLKNINQTAHIVPYHVSLNNNKHVTYDS